MRKAGSVSSGDRVSWHLGRRVSDTVLIIDGHSMAFRAFYAPPPDNFCDGVTGQHTNAVYGFASMLTRL